MIVRRMFGFMINKMVRLVSLLIAVTVLTFVLVQSSPVDQVQAYVGADMMRVSAEQRAQIEAYWGLDRPPLEQFMRWSQALLQGDLGTSMIYRQPVADVIRDRFFHSAALLLAAWILSGLIGFTLGLIAAMKRHSRLDGAIQWVCYTLAATPAFWFGLLLLVVFAVWLGWFPIGMGIPAGILADEVTWTDKALHMILPALTLSIVGISPIALHTRQKLVHVLESDFVLFARARGESGIGLLMRHGIRHAALPALTLQFASFSELFGGAILAEQVFSYPGLGEVTVEAGVRGDVPLLLGIVLFSTIFVFIGNTIADLLYRFIDPRLRISPSLKAGDA